MTITLLTFAQAREFFGVSERVLTVPDGLTAAAVLDTVRAGWREALPSSRAAIDLEYADWEQPLRDGQTLAVIPPVSGG